MPISKKALELRNKRIGIAVRKAHREGRVKKVSREDIERRNESIRKSHNTPEYLAKARVRTSEFWRNGVYDNKCSKGEGNPFYGKTHTEETRKKISEHARKRVGKNNPMFGKRRPDTSERNLQDNPVYKIKDKDAYRKKLGAAIRRRFDLNPESHPNRILAKNRKLGLYSMKQIQMYNKIKMVFADAELEQRIPSTRRFADVFVPSLMIDFEYDGQHFHKDKSKDRARDKEIKNAGYKVVRFNKDNLHTLESILVNLQDGQTKK